MFDKLGLLWKEADVSTGHSVMQSSDQLTDRPREELCKKLSASSGSSSYSKSFSCMQLSFGHDNSRVFAIGEIHPDLVESTALGKRFPQENAHDPNLCP